MVNNRVFVDSQGVNFGGRYWVSHETITGCEAPLIPSRHHQYWEWVLNANLATSSPHTADEYDGALINLNLALLLRRFILLSNKSIGDSSFKVLAGKAQEFLNSHNLSGNPLR